MDSKELTEKLFGSTKLASGAKAIAKELANRDLFALTDFPRFLKRDSEHKFTKQCVALYDLVRGIIGDGDNMDKLLKTDKRLVWLNVAIWMGEKDGQYNTDTVAMYVCIHLISKYGTTMDEHVENLTNTELCSQLGIAVDDEGLTDLSDARLELKRRAIIFDGKLALFPHQFMRRYYTSNFVFLPTLLKHAKDSGLDVSIRIDPLRKTEAKYYTKESLVEADFWYGPKFSAELLNNPRTSKTTRHYSTGVTNMVYDARYTIFRTKMMDKTKKLREFSIEEYCPLETPMGEPASAWGEKYYIQKFGHLVYDQNTGYFEHLDGAVRVFTADEYEQHFTKVASGQGDVDEMIGERRKIFQVREGKKKLDIDTAQEILTEWFRYNPHIEEYFSNTKIEPYISYERLAEIKAESQFKK
ncbi:MAG: hypothetical protein JWN38_175 [Candidatus Saccharibacteria bacterium]|nr:hypothetical protein [Candidatus Saccharibacteria bacterium]